MARKYNYGISSGKVSKSDGQVINWGDKINSSNNLSETIIGGKSGLKIDDTNLHTAPNGLAIFAIKAMEDSIINTVTGDIDLDGETVLESDIIYGTWSNIELTSGKVIIYYKDV